MSILRINLHVRSDVSPHLFQALILLPPRPRAEFLRRIAERGLQIECGSALAPESSQTRAPSEVPDKHPKLAPAQVPDTFGEDLASIIGFAP